jgi:hypothetical protein
MFKSVFGIARWKYCCLAHCLFLHHERILTCEIAMLLEEIVWKNLFYGLLLVGVVFIQQLYSRERLKDTRPIELQEAKDRSAG